MSESVCCKTKGDAFVILENLKASEFEIFHKTFVLDEDHVRLIFKTCGRSHVIRMFA